MKLSGVHILFIIIGVLVLVWVFSSCKLRCGSSSGEGYSLYDVPGFYQADVDYLPTVGDTPTGEGGFVEEDAAYDTPPSWVISPEEIFEGFEPSQPGDDYNWEDIPDDGGKYHFGQNSCLECINGCLLDKHARGGPIDKRSEQEQQDVCRQRCQDVNRC